MKTVNYDGGLIYYPDAVVDMEDNKANYLKNRGDVITSAAGLSTPAPIPARVDNRPGANTDLLKGVNGVSLNAKTNILKIIDTVTPANNYEGDPVPKFGSIRTSGALQFGYDGFLQWGPENLLPRSQELDHGVWTPVGISVTANDQIAPDGTLTGETFLANVGGTSGISQTYTAAGPVNTLSIHAKNIIGNGWLRLNLTNNGSAVNLAAWFRVAGAGSIGTIQSGILSANIVALPNGWFRCSITAPATIGVVETAYIRMAGADASGVSQSGWSIGFWGTQLERGSVARTYLPTVASPSYGLRRGFDPRLGGVAGYPIEESRTNSAFNTIFSGAGVNVAPTNWTFAGGSGNWSPVASIFGAADGAQAINFVSVAERPFWTSNTITLNASTVYVYSAYIEAKISGGAAINNIMAFNSLPAGATVTYRMNGDPAIGSTQVVPGRIEVIVTVDVTAGSTVLRLGIGTGSPITANFIISRPQFELGAFATTYIPSGVGATATRSADVPVLAGTLFPLNQVEGTLYAKVVMYSGGVTNQTYLSLDDNSTNEFHTIYRTGNRLSSFFIADGGVAQIGSSGLRSVGSVADLVPTKSAAGYKLNDCAVAQAGELIQSDQICTMPTVTALGFGTRSYNSLQLNGWILETAYYAIRKSDAELAQLAAA